MGCHHPNQDGQNHQPGISNISRPKYSDLPNDGMRWFRILRGFGIRPGLHRIVNGLSICYWRGYLSRFVLSCCFFLQFIWKNTGWQHLGFSLFLRLKTMVRSFLVKSTCFVGKLLMAPKFCLLENWTVKKTLTFPVRVVKWNPHVDWTHMFASETPILFKATFRHVQHLFEFCHHVFSTYFIIFLQSSQVFPQILLFSPFFPKISEVFLAAPWGSRRGSARPSTTGHSRWRPRLCSWWLTELGARRWRGGTRRETTGGGWLGWGLEMDGLAGGHSKPQRNTLTLL
jgi:hypothetical protein